MGFIYELQEIGNETRQLLDYVKIGYAGSTVEKRLNGSKTYFRDKDFFPKVIFTFETEYPAELEWQIHLDLAQYRVDREWFSLTSELTQYMQTDNLKKVEQKVINQIKKEELQQRLKELAFEKKSLKEQLKELKKQDRENKIKELYQQLNFSDYKEQFIYFYKEFVATNIIPFRGLGRIFETNMTYMYQYKNSYLYVDN